MVNKLGVGELCRIIANSFRRWDEADCSRGWIDEETSPFEGLACRAATFEAIDEFLSGCGQTPDAQLMSLGELFIASQASSLMTRLLHALRHVGSPIELKFAVALATAVGARFECFAVKNDASHDIFGPPYGSDMLVCLPQFTIAGYKADFLCQIAGLEGDSFKTIGSVIVECDGHDFHERTKEQAKRDRSRDRAIQAAGYKVFRFTGSEIFADPFKCVGEVLTVLDQMRREHRSAKRKEAK